MKLRRIPANLKILLTSPSVFLETKQYILILSHMRSYSSLLGHLLGSHDEIAGYAEMHQRYEKRTDLLRLRARVFEATNGNLGAQFVLDKVLHDRYPLADSLLNRDSVHPLFLVRKPEPTIKSLVHMGKTIQHERWFERPENAYEYYVRRIGVLEKTARALDHRRGIALAAEMIIEQPAETLAFLSDRLQLRSPLQDTYKLFKYTGTPGKGDFSATIGAGRIVRARSDYADIAVPSDLLRQAQNAYDRCFRTFGARCATMDRDASHRQDSPRTHLREDAPRSGAYWPLR